MNELNNIVSLIGVFAGQYIASLESLLATCWNLPLFSGVTLGPLILFFLIMGFVWSLFLNFFGGDD